MRHYNALQELVRSAAWTQLQSSANHTQTVDYSLANALLHQEGVLNADSFQDIKKFKEYIRYLSQNPGLQKNCKKLIVNAKDFDEILKIFEQHNIESIEEVQISNTDAIERNISINKVFILKNLKKLTVKDWHKIQCAFSGEAPIPSSLEAVCFNGVTFENGQPQSFLRKIPNLKSLLIIHARNTDLDLGNLPCLSSLNEINLSGDAQKNNAVFLAAAGKNLERVADISFRDAELSTFLQTAPKLKDLAGTFSKPQRELIAQHAHLKQIKIENFFSEETPILPDLEEFSCVDITFDALVNLVKAHPHLKSLKCREIIFSRSMQEGDFQFLKTSSIRACKVSVYIKQPEDINNLLCLAKALPCETKLSMIINNFAFETQIFDKEKNIIFPNYCKQVSVILTNKSRMLDRVINLHAFQKAETLNFEFMKSVMLNFSDMPSFPNLKKIVITNFVNVKVENVEAFLLECINKAPNLEEIVMILKVSPGAQPPFSSPEASARFAELVATRKLAVNIKIDDRPFIVPSLIGATHGNQTRSSTGRSSAIGSPSNTDDLTTSLAQHTRGNEPLTEIGAAAPEIGAPSNKVDSTGATSVSSKDTRDLEHAPSTGASEDLPGTGSGTDLSQTKDFFKTNSDNPTLKAKRYFLGIKPNLYRLWIWQPDLKSLEKTYTQPDDFTSVALPTAVPAPSGFQLEPGALSVTAAAGKEIILPSLNPKESIAELQIIDTQTGQPFSGFRLERSAKTGFHRVVLPKSGNYTIHFKVAFPNQMPDLPPELSQLRDRYNAFTPQDLSVPNFTSLKEAAQYYRENKTGRCELRALAAYAELLETGNYSPDNVRIITNAAHTYLEVQHDGHWHSLDLGGYPATIQEELAVPVNPKPVAPRPVALKEHIQSLRQVLLLDEPGLTFYSVSNAAALQTFYKTKLKQYSAQNIFVAQKPSDLSDTGHGMNEAGKIVPNYTAFRRWLDAANRSNGRHLLLIDIRGWAPEETAQLNDWLDRKLSRPDDWPDIQLIGNSSRPYEAHGPDFRRRVQKGVHVDIPEATLLAPRLAVDKEGKEGSQIIEIDLFQSPFYKRLLIGGWRMQPDSRYPASAHELAMSWQDGELLKIIQSASSSNLQIVIKNAPVHDPEFQAFWTTLTTLRTIERADKVVNLPETISFYGSAAGYDWKTLSDGVTLEPVIESDWTTLPCLSDANLLSFIENPAYQFSTDGKLVCCEAFLARAQRENKPLRVLCAPGLSESGLAQFLTHANRLKVPVTFVSPARTLPEQSVLKRLNITAMSTATPISLSSNVVWEVHEDVYLRTRQLQDDRTGSTTVLDTASLVSAELGRFPNFTEEDKRLFLERSQLSLNAVLSDILIKLQAGETVVLAGPIPPMLHEPITKLSLGTIEGERFRGKLIMVAPPKEKTLLETWAGQTVAIQPPDRAAKQRYLNLLNEHMRLNFEQFQNQMLQSNPQLVRLTWEMPRDLALSDKNLAALEQALQKTLEAKKAQLRQQQARASHQSRQGVPDERRAAVLDKTRLKKIEEGFALSPWVMVEGKTGIGKTHFIQNVLPAKMKVCHSLEEWLKAKPQKGRPIVLAVDEANFDSQLSNQGENFLDRFKTLKGNPPGFLWQGKYYELTDQHRALFAFNPGSYGAGRTEPSLLKDHKVSVSFSRLPDFYIRANILNSLQTKLFKSPLTRESSDAIARPVLEMYQWLVQRSGDDALITPRELKAMMHLIAAKVNRVAIKETQTLTNLATEAAYLIGRQTVLDKPSLLKEFNKNFKSKNSVLASEIPAELGDLAASQYRAKEYGLIQEILHAKDNLLSTSNPDLGLGGLILEGGSGIGKSYFVKEITDRYEKTGKPVVRIGSNASFVEKERLLRDAFAQGALVLAEEFNTSFWPNKLLNNFLMGLDAQGQPAKKPGFFLLATQNPPAFEGRSELDPALRRRMMKLSLSHWPVYTPQQHPEHTLNGARDDKENGKALLYSRGHEAASGDGRAALIPVGSPKASRDGYNQ